MWFVYVFATNKIVDIKLDDGFVWISTHEVINSLHKILSGFLIKLNALLSEKFEHYLKTNISEWESLIFITLNILINCNLIKKKLCRKFKQKNDKKYKTENFLSFGTYLWKLKNTNELQVYLKPAIIKYIFNNPYIFENHYTSIKPLVRKNPLNKKNSKIINRHFIDLRLNMKLYLRWNFFENATTLIFNYYGSDANLNIEKFINLIDEKKHYFWKKSVQREFSQIFSLNYFLQIKNIKNLLLNGFYFHYYFDFRGRIYADSPIAYTHNRLFRYFYYYGQYTADELIQFRKDINPDMLKYFDFLKKNTDIITKYSKINFNDVVCQYYIIIIFFEIGKIFKKYYTDIYNGRLEYENILSIGVKYYNIGTHPKETLYSQLEFMSLVYMLEDLNCGCFFKYPIFKDATASGLQILTILLGVKTVDIFTQSNFTTKNVWFDTYYYIIKKFFDSTEIPIELQHKYFTRSILKKTIMTYNYNATLITCWDYFKDEAGLPQHFENELNKIIWPYFKNFYKFLQILFEGGEYYAQPSKQIVDFFKSEVLVNDELRFKTSGDFEMLLRYFELMDGRRLDLIIPGLITKRATYLTKMLSDIPDDTKTYRALRANITHFFDAYLIRKITVALNKPVITIHDSIGIDILNIQNFENVVKNTFQNFYDMDPFRINKANQITIKIESNFIFI